MQDNLSFKKEGIHISIHYMQNVVKGALGNGRRSSFQAEFLLLMYFTIYLYFKHIFSNSSRENINVVHPF
jgi:hypothetical protein